MMRLARRASLLAALCVLTSAATAYAECAWVLWKGTHEPKAPIGAFTTQKQCEGRRNVMLLAEAKIEQTSLQCLPDTMAAATTCKWVLWMYSLVEITKPTRTVFKTQAECEKARDVANRTTAKTDKMPFQCFQDNIASEASFLWILWRHPFEITESPMGTFKTQEQCERRLDVMHLTKAKTEKTSFRCFPDTVDPRGPKDR